MPQRSRVATAAFLALCTVGVAARANEPTGATGAPAAPDAPTDGDGGRIAAARAAYEEGLHLGHLGRWEEAVAALERSERLRPHPLTAYNIGFCELSLRHYTRAKRALGAALAARDAAGAPALPEDVRRGALEYLDEAEESLARVRVKVLPSDALLSVDGRPLEILAPAEGGAGARAGTRERSGPEAVPGGAIDVEMDPGKHVYRVVLPGGGETAEEHESAAGQGSEITLRVSPPTRPKEPRRPAVTASKEPDVRDLTAPGRSRVPAYAALAVGAAGVATGSVFGLLALDKTGSLARECPKKACEDAQARSNLDTANAYATIATVGFVVGAAGLLSGGYLWYSAPAPVEPRKASRRLLLTPTLGWKSVSFSAAF